MTMKIIFKNPKTMRFLLLALIVLSLSFLTSCERDDSKESSNDGGSLSILVNTEPWKNKGGEETSTRTNYSAIVESGGSKILPTTFCSGDAIGVFIVDKSGKVVVANRKFTYNGGTWVTGNTVEYTGDMTGYTYYAYYPYQDSPSSAPGMGDNVSTSPSDTEFFASMIKDWIPNSDQSTIEGFSGSDLMTAKGTATMPYSWKVQVSFTMKHRMGLLATKETLSYYNINDAADTWTVKQTFTGNIPYVIGDCLYFFAKPGVETALGSKKATVGSGEVEQLYFSKGEPSEKSEK